MFFVYVSFENESLDNAISVASTLLSAGHFPFVPRLSKLIPGRTDQEWIRYYSLWMLRCDCLFATPTARKHELQFARESGVPIIESVDAVNRLKLPAYGELGKHFGVELAKTLEAAEPDENWRIAPFEEVVKDFTSVCGGWNPDKYKERTLVVGVRALRLWDFINQSVPRSTPDPLRRLRQPVKK